MSSDRIAIPQEDYEEVLDSEISGSKRPRKNVHEVLKRQKQNSNTSVIELNSDTDTNSQQKTNTNLQKKIDLNKVADQLILIPNAKPPGPSWIWGYFDQYKSFAQYKRIVKCLAQVQRKNGIELCNHFMGSDGSTGNFILHLATHRITEEEI